MRKFTLTIRIVLAFLLVLSTALFVACGDDNSDNSGDNSESSKPAHVCQHVCEVCGKCLDANCTDPACSDKCGGHKPTEVNFDGLNVTLAQGTQSALHLSTQAPTTIIDTSKIEVRECDLEGNLIDALISGYSVKLYRGSKEITLENGVAEVGEGAYQIWVYKQSEYLENYMRKAFVSVYVLDDVVSLEWNSAAEGTVVSQEKGKDEISQTWKFTATYESGRTREISASDVEFVVKPDTTSVGDNLSAVAVYSEKNALSELKTSSEATVTYSVTKKQSGNVETKTVVINMTDVEAGSYTEETQIGEGVYLMGTSAKAIAIDGNKKSADGLTFTQRLKLGGAGSTAKSSVKFVLEGPSTITVYAITSSSSDTSRTLSLYTAEGILVEGSTTDGLPNAATKCTFEAESAGTYYVWGSAAINIYYIAVSTEIAAAPQGKDPVIINVSDLEAGSYTEETQIGEGVYLMGTSAKAIAIDGNKKSADGLTFTQRIKLGGAGDNTKCSIKVQTDSAATVTVYAITSSGSDTSRTLSLYTEAGAIVEGSTSDGIPNEVTKVTFTLSDAGTYFIAGTNGINIYYISVVFD